MMKVKKIDVKKDSVFRERLGELSDVDWDKVQSSVELVRSYFPEIDLYDAHLSGGRFISFGAKKLEEKKGKPLLFFDNTSNGLCIRVRGLSKNRTEPGKAGVLISSAVGKDYKEIRNINLDLFRYTETKAAFEKLLKLINGLSEHKVIQQKISGNGYFPEDYFETGDFGSDDLAVAYISSERRKEIEEKAVNYVIKKHEKDGYAIKDRQKDNCGYDLLATKGSKRLELEVKGTSSKQPRFFISRNEYRYAKEKDNKNWRLVLIYNIDDKPKEMVMTVKEMEEVFDMDSLCWECIRK